MKITGPTSSDEGRRVQSLASAQAHLRRNHIIYRFGHCDEPKCSTGFRAAQPINESCSKRATVAGAVHRTQPRLACVVRRDARSLAFCWAAAHSVAAIGISSNVRP